MLYNKKIIINTLCLSLLICCVASTNIPIDEKVLQANSIAYTLDIYDNYIDAFKRCENIRTCDYDEYSILSEKVDMKDSFIDIYAIDCFIKNTFSYNSDECIIFRRNNNEETKLKTGAFDYKRFLPKNSAVKTDTDFLLLVNKYKEYKNDENNKLKNCYEINKDNSLIFTERQEKYNQCQLYNENKNKKIEKLLKLYIFEGGLEDEKKQEQLKKEFERQKEELERQKAELVRQQQIAYQNDCDQAEKKADEANKKLENYKEKINYNNLHDLNKYKVVDFATKGVMLEYNYNSPRYFVYTTDKNYANGDYFHGGEYYYTKSNNVYKYTTIFGGINSISILIPTRYKVKDIEEMEKQTDYHSHLKNKNILSCWIYIYYKDENGEEVMIRRE